jgi:transposase InsO family protein
LSSSVSRLIEDERLRAGIAAISAANYSCCGVRASAGSAGDSFDNALAENVNGEYKTELVNKSGPWEGYESLNLRTAEWIHWHNNFRSYTRKWCMTKLSKRRILLDWN